MRDFIVLHYHLNQRGTVVSQQACANMAVPEGLRWRMDLYAASGRLVYVDTDLFREPSWFEVMEGQNLRPKRWLPWPSLQGLEDTVKFEGRVRHHRQLCLRDARAFGVHSALLPGAQDATPICKHAEKGHRKRCLFLESKQGPETGLAVELRVVLRVDLEHATRREWLWPIMPMCCCMICL